MKTLAAWEQDTRRQMDRACEMIRSAKASLRAAKTDEERATAQSELDAANRHLDTVYLRTGIAVDHNRR